MPQQHQLFLHRVGLFGADGTAVTFGSFCWTGRPDIPVPPALTLPGHGALYHVPMDLAALQEHWLRLHCEQAALGARDPQLAPYARPQALRHGGGAPHPQYPHVRLGGTFTWDAPPHPAIARQMDRIRALAHDDLVRALAGPRFPN